MPAEYEENQCVGVDRKGKTCRGVFHKCETCRRRWLHEVQYCRRHNKDYRINNFSSDHEKTTDIRRCEICRRQKEDQDRGKRIVEAERNQQEKRCRKEQEEEEKARREQNIARSRVTNLRLLPRAATSLTNAKRSRSRQQQQSNDAPSSSQYPPPSPPMVSHFADWDWKEKVTRKSYETASSLKKSFSKMSLGSKTKQPREDE